MTDPMDIVTRLRAVLHNDRSVELMNREAADEIERLRAERDEARRDVCSMMHMTGFLGGDYAHSKGWDCFKDGHTGFSTEIQNFRDIFYGYKDKLKAERDEARRIACGLIYDQASSPNTTKQSIAEAEGWDCYKEDGNV